MMPVNTFELPITGMTCVGCAKSIERSLNLQKGVVSSAVNFTQNHVVVSIDPSQVDREQVIQTIRDLGFEIVEANANRLLIRQPLLINWQTIGSGDD
jgi:Cu+-exporting ATPase